MSPYKLGLGSFVFLCAAALGMGCSSSSSSPGGTGGTGGSVTPSACAAAVAGGVRTCVSAVNAAWDSCYQNNDAPCASDDANVAAALSARNINVVDMESYVTPAPMSSELIFHARVEAEVPQQGDIEELGDSLDDIANEMDVDVQLESS